MTYTPDELKAVLDAHAKWLRGEGGNRADLRGADLRGADLRGANLRGANLRGIIVNWQDHQLLSEILLRSAGEDVQRRMVAGLIRISSDWCWKRLLAIEHPEREWALDKLAKWVKDGDSAPEILQERAKTKEVQP